MEANGGSDTIPLLSPDKAWKLVDIEDAGPVEAATSDEVGYCPVPVGDIVVGYWILPELWVL